MAEALQRLHQLGALHELLGRDVEQLAGGRVSCQLSHDCAALARALLRAQVRRWHAAAWQLQQSFDLLGASTSVDAIQAARLCARLVDSYNPVA